MNPHDLQTTSRSSAYSSEQSLIRTHAVLRNTYMLLGLTILFSGLTAAWSVYSNARPMSPVLLLVGMFGLSFLVQATRNSAMGLVSAFLFTGFMGYTLGPILNFYLHNISNGGQIIATALVGTGVIFFALSAYVIASKKNFTYMGGTLVIGICVAFLCSLAAVFFQMPAMSIAASALFMLISSGLIMFYTSQIIYGGETNYITATISIYVAIYNMFISLLQILGAFNNRD